MGFSFRLFYGWLVEKGLIDPEIKEDDFIDKALNGFNSSLFIRWYDKHREMETKLKVAVDDIGEVLFLIDDESLVYRELTKLIEKIKAK